MIMFDNSTVLCEIKTALRNNFIIAMAYKKTITSEKFSKKTTAENISKSMVKI